MRKLRSIQVLRAVAACAVVVVHSYLRSGQFEANALRLGAAGVDLFFVISGFIMAHVAVGRTSGQFIRDRIWRIYPMWWLAVVPWLFIMDFSVQNLLASATLWPVYGDSFSYPVPKLGWTLCFEMLFYAAMAVAIATRPALPLALFAMCLLLALSTDIGLFGFIGNPLILEFLAGVWIARLPRDGRFGLALIAIGLSAFAVSPQAFFSLDVASDSTAAAFRAIFWGGPAALIVYGSLSIDRSFGHRIWNVPVLLGDASYSIYLFHLVIINALTAYWVWEVFMAIAGGLAIFWVVERRIPEFRKNLRRWRANRFGIGPQQVQS